MRLLRTAALAAAAFAALAAGFVSPAPARADLRRLETEFKAAIERVESATVVVVPAGSPAGGAPLSGVIVSKSGLVLTTSEAGRIDEMREKQPATRWTDDVEVRVPDLKKGTFTNYRARVVKRMPEVSSALVAVADPPKNGFASWLPPSTSADLHVGAFTFAMGNAFGMASESPPSLTAGVVASLVRRAGSSDQGAYDVVYTTAAINPGVSGGPIVDVHGRLVAIVVGWVDAGTEPDSPFQFLGRGMPVDRLRAVWSGVAEARDAFAAAAAKPLTAEEAPALEDVVAHAARTAAPSVVSLEIRRKAPVSSTAIGPAGRPVDLPRYRGPVSAVAASEDGLVVTSLYNVTNLATIMNPGMAQALPPAASAKAGLDAIESAVVHLGGGVSVPAKLVAIHETLGVAAFRAELPAGRRLAPLPAAPAEGLAEGRFVLALGNPFGAPGSPDPLVTFGILSKRHADDADSAWRGHWQTDARATDGNCGGAVVDLRGRIVGLLALWDTAHHGRASGIGFVLPWSKVAAALPDLAAGKSFRRPFLGVRWKPGVPGAIIDAVVDGSSAKAAGLQAGDEFLEIDGSPVKSPEDCTGVLTRKWAGETVRLKMRRGAGVLDIEAVLGARD